MSIKNKKLVFFLSVGGEKTLLPLWEKLIWINYYVQYKKEVELMLDVARKCIKDEIAAVVSSVPVSTIESA